jgi:DNA-binding LytR/AlgR family response regulator
MTTCIIIDDEPLSRDVLRKYIGELKDLTLLAECHNAFEATELLNSEKVDLIFLDINMPGLSGISFARSLAVSPLIIFTTAYPEYAVEGFELNALDYLVKPYSFERFFKAVNRANERLLELKSEGDASRKIVVKADKKIYALDFSEIQFIEGQGDYMKVHLVNKMLVVHQTLKSILESLPEEEFMQIHKSYLVNLTHIEFIEGNQVKVGEQSIPVSPTNREELIQRFSSL